MLVSSSSACPAVLNCGSGVVVPVYVAGLLLSDLLPGAALAPVVCSPPSPTPLPATPSFRRLVWCVGAGAGFLACISLERYLAVVRPARHRGFQAAECALPVSLALLACCSLLVLFSYFLYVPFLLYPPCLGLTAFFCTGTWSGSATTGSEESKSTWTQALALFILGSKYGPFAVTCAIPTPGGHVYFNVICTLLGLNVVFDPLLSLLVSHSSGGTGEPGADQGDPESIPEGDQVGEQEAVSSV